MWPASINVARTPGASSSGASYPGCPAEIVEAVQCVYFRVQGGNVLLAVTTSGVMASVVPCVLFLQMAGIQHDQPCQFPRCGTGDDFAFEAFFHEERHAAAVVKVCMGEQQEVDGEREPSH